MSKSGPKKPKEVTCIELDGDASLRLREPWGKGMGKVWYFCRGDTEIRHIDSRYLEQELIDKIVKLMTK